MARNSKQDAPRDAVAEAQAPLVAGTPEAQRRDAAEVLRRGVAAQEAARTEEPQIDPANASPTGDAPASVEEAQAMVEHVGNPYDLDGFKAATPSGQLYFEKLLIRPGTVVQVTQDAYRADDLRERVTLVEGDRVPDGAGYIPANYISDVERLRLIGK